MLIYNNCENLFKRVENQILNGMYQIYFLHFDTLYLNSNKEFSLFLNIFDENLCACIYYMYRIWKVFLWSDGAKFKQRKRIILIIKFYRCKNTETRKSYKISIQNWKCHIKFQFTKFTYFYLNIYLYNSNVVS